MKKVKGSFRKDVKQAMETWVVWSGGWFGVVGASGEKEGGVRRIYVSFRTHIF